MQIVSGAALLPGSFTRRFTYADGDERDFVAQVATLAKRDRHRIHLLADDSGKDYGFVALSVSETDNKPSLVIDFLFTSLPYRGTILPELNMKISDYLIGYSIQVATRLSETVPIRYIALQPATVELLAFYNRRGFKKLDSTDWMFLRF